VYKRADVLKLFEREPDRVLRPLNYPREAAGRGATTVATAAGTPVGVVNLQGRVFMDPADDPFRVASEAVAALATRVVVVDFHAEATSEKRAMGWHLDGQVSILFGTHTHVPTADEEILPQGTAYVTDVGMCGPYRSIIGRKPDPVLKRFRTRMYAPFDVATEDVRACGVLVDVDEETGKARSIERVTLRLDDA
jgi:metallophosphoesterase (TIGR00282 family)